MFRAIGLLADRRARHRAMYPNMAEDPDLAIPRSLLFDGKLLFDCGDLAINPRTLGAEAFKASLQLGMIVLRRFWITN
jgi:hypothetical protein